MHISCLCGVFQFLQKCHSLTYSFSFSALQAVSKCFCSMWNNRVFVSCGNFALHFSFCSVPRASRDNGREPYSVFNVLDFPLLFYHIASPLYIVSIYKHIAWQSLFSVHVAQKTVKCWKKLEKWKLFISWYERWNILKTSDSASKYTIAVQHIDC